MRLDQFSDEILCALWPVESVLMGAVVSKKLREVLQSVQHVRFLVNPRSLLRFQRQHSGVWDEEVVRRIGEALCFFRHAGKMTVEFTDQEQGELLTRMGVSQLEGSNQARILLAALGMAAGDEGCNNIHEITLGGLPDELLSHSCTVDGRISDFARLQRIEIARIGEFRDGFQAGLSFTRCSSLTELTLSELNLRTKPTLFLAQSLNLCSRIQSLHLTNAELPQWRQQSAAARDTFWQALVGRTTLTDLSLSGTILSVISDGALWNSFSALTSLRFLDMSSTSQWHDPGDPALPNLFQRMLVSLPRSGALTHLDLSQNIVLSPGALALADAVESWPFLRFLSFGSNGIEDEGALSAVLGALGHCCPRLAHLDLNGDVIDWSSGKMNYPRCGRKFCSALLETQLSNWPQLTNLNVATCVGGLAQDEQFAASLGNCTRLHTLKVSHTSSIPGLARHCPALKNLSISDVDSAAEFFASLSKLTGLETLQFGHMTAGAFDSVNNLAENLFQFLPPLLQLSKLDLAFSALGPSGATALADVLPGCVLLERLLLMETSIQTEGAEHLACCLLEMKRLTQLDLCRCDIGEPGTLSVCTAIPSQLTDLDLSLNAIGAESYDKLSLRLPAFPFLASVRLQVHEPASATLSARARLVTSLETAGRLRLLRVDGFTGSSGNGWNRELESLWADEGEDENEEGEEEGEIDEKSGGEDSAAAEVDDEGEEMDFDDEEEPEEDGEDEEDEEDGDWW